MLLPADFEKQMISLLGEEGFSALSDSLDESPRIAFRPNAAKGAQTADGLERVPWSSSGVYLRERPAFTFDPLLHAGAYYVEEPSSMFVEQALRQVGKPHRVLDLCAAPGGKSTLLRSLLDDDVLLVCNEPVATRAQVLLENMLKWGHASVVVTNDYPVDFAALTGFFDVIAADVPCSGEGMFRKDAGAVSEWSPAAVSTCAARQMDIVRSVWPALAVGGYLIYSTCTYNAEENERNVERICRELQAEVVEINVDESWGVTGNLLKGTSFPVCRFLPSRTGGEGFFLAMLRKKGEETFAGHRKGKEMLAPLKKCFGCWLDDRVDQWRQWERADTVFAIPDVVAADFGRLSAVCRVLSAGIPIATLKGGKQVPHQGLALSTHLKSRTFPEYEVNREEALNYLRRLSFSLPSDCERGYVLLTYHGFPLGFVNNLGNRANNLYPQNWKIRSSYAADMTNDFIHVTL